MKFGQEVGRHLWKVRRSLQTGMWERGCGIGAEIGSWWHWMRRAESLSGLEVDRMLVEPDRCTPHCWTDRWRYSRSCSVS